MINKLKKKIISSGPMPNGRGKFKKPKSGTSARKVLPYKEKKPIIKRGFGGAYAKAAAKKQLKEAAKKRAAEEAAKKAAREAAKEKARIAAKRAATREANKAKKAALAEQKRLAAKRIKAGKSGLLVLGGAGVAGTIGKATYDLAGPKVSSAKQTYEPKKHVVPSKSKSYSIKSGDTLSQIAKRQGTTLKALLAANPSITNPNKIRIGQKIKMSAPVKGRKSVYQGLSKSQMAGMTMKRGVGGSVIRSQLKKAIKEFTNKGGKISQIPSQTRKSAGIKERIPTPAERKHLQAELKRINDQIRSLERITARTGKAGSGSGMSRSGPAEFGTQMRGSGRVPAASVEQKRGGVVMKKQVGGRMSRVGLSPAEMARAGVMSEARRKRYMNNAGTGVINRGPGGSLAKAALRKELKKATKEFIEKGGKITKIKEVKPRADYTAGPIKRKKKGKGGEKKPFVRKVGGVIKRKNSGRVVKITKYPEHKPRKNYGKKRIGRSTAKVVRKSGGTLLVASMYD